MQKITKQDLWRCHFELCLIVIIIQNKLIDQANNQQINP